MSITALQAATILTCHEFAAKFVVTGAIRLYSWLGPNKEEWMNSRIVKDLGKAQMNCSEYSALMAAPLFYLAAIGEAASPMGVLLTLAGQIGYFYARVFDGYPKIPAASFATIRYIGFFLICKQVAGLAYPGGKK